ncbi:RagB/SusD family nutrient uptake outer membrane protein [Gaetbulibacter sp. M240]|uniref:RagB/SusD family nutrient uptake outer membrane protein n=1 Tax=Gaetbulibacter sp. M240 TaxID=3126511 RepID=UPI00374EECE6
MRQYKFNKNIQLGVLIFTILAICFSCQNILDEQPQSEIGPKDFWKNNTDAESGIIGMYDAMQPAYRVAHFLWGEFRSDSYKLAQDGAPIDYKELVLQNITSGNRETLKWDNLYELINRANTAIKYIPQITAYNESLLAEAHAARAFAYFDAIRVWGSVPLFTEPTESVADLQKSRTPGDQILNEVIIPDMLKAESIIGPPTSDFRFSKSSILCLQAEVYMWMKDYPKAKEAIEKMIALGGHSLVTSVQAWQDLFSNTPQTADTPDGRGKIQTGPELIFSIRFDLAEDEDNPGQRLANRSGVYRLFYAGIPSFYISDSLNVKWTRRFPTEQAEWDAKYPGVQPAVTTSTGPLYGDWRYFASRQGRFDGFEGNALVAKWNYDNFSPVQDDTDIVLYRYAGMLLMLAEAENQLNADGIRALEILNQLRSARLLPQVTMAEFGLTQEDRENYLLDERQFELLGEGKRWWDLRRTDKAIEILNPILSEIPEASILTEDRLLFPIYFEHLDENPNLLPQNTGY